MLNVALTGNIASGKSSVARLFRDWGATVIDADRLVHEVERPGTAVYRRIVAHFGDGVVAADGTLDRAALRRRIATDGGARAALQAIVHPAVRAERDRLAGAAATRGDSVLVSEIPLLFEVLDPDAFDLVVLVDAPPAVRRRRLVEGRGLDPAEAERLIATQMPAGRKRARSDIVIENGGTLSELEAAARAAWSRIAARAQPGTNPG